MSTRQKKVIIIVSVLLVLSIGIGMFFLNRNKGESNMNGNDQYDPTPGSPTPSPTPDPTPSIDPRDMSLEEWIELNRYIPDILPTSEHIEREELYRVQGELRLTFEPSFRFIFYAAPLIDQLMTALDISTDEWHEWVEHLRIDDYELEEMHLVSFIKYFRVPRDVFEEVLEQEAFRRDVSNTDVNHERHELPNADIIYTFDNEIINNFYRR